MDSEGFVIRRVGHRPDSCPLGGIDRGVMPRDTDSEAVHADQQQALAASEGGRQAGGVVEVAVADLSAARGKVVELRRRSSDQYEPFLEGVIVEE